jgi:hypothetical protein
MKSILPFTNGCLAKAGALVILYPFSTVKVRVQ